MSETNGHGVATDVRVRAIRQVRGGVQCEVHVGFSAEQGDVWVQCTARDSETMSALTMLQDALVAAGDRALKQAQDEREKRGRKAVGRL